MDENKITLELENGEEVELLIEDQFLYNDKEYIVLYEDEESEDAYLYRIDEDEEGKIILTEVEDDDEFDEVSEFYFSAEFEDEE